MHRVRNTRDPTEIFESLYGPVMFETVWLEGGDPEATQPECTGHNVECFAVHEAYAGRSESRVIPGGLLDQSLAVVGRGERYAADARRALAAERG